MARDTSALLLERTYLTHKLKAHVIFINILLQDMGGEDDFPGRDEDGQGSGR